VGEVREEFIADLEVLKMDIADRLQVMVSWLDSRPRGNDKKRG